MYAIELDRSKRLLVISAAQKVTAEEAKMVAQRIGQVLQDVAPGFRVLADFRGLESMDPSAARHIAKIMDALAEKNVASVTRLMRGAHVDRMLDSQVPCRQRSFNRQSTAFVMRGLSVRLRPLALETL